MSKSQHSEAQMIGALKQLEAGRKAEDVAREVRCRSTRSMPGRPSTARMDASEAQEARQLRDENTKLKKLVVDLSLDKEIAESGDRKKRVELGDQRSDARWLRVALTPPRRAL